MLSTQPTSSPVALHEESSIQLSDCLGVSILSYHYYLCRSALVGSSNLIYHGLISPGILYYFIGIIHVWDHLGPLLFHFEVYKASSTTGSSIFQTEDWENRFSIAI